MKNSRLILVIQSLSNKKRRDLTKFVHSNYFNNHSKVAVLWDYLLESIEKFDYVPGRQQISKHIYPKKAYNDQQIRLLCSYLLKTIEKYLVIQHYINDDLKSKVILAQEYRKLNLPKHFSSAVSNVQQVIAKSPFRNADYHSLIYELALEEYAFTSSSKRTENLNLQEVTDSIDINYLALKLRQTCLLLSHQAVFKADYNFGMLEDVIRYIEQQGYLDIPAIAMYYYCYFTVTEPENVSHFNGFKQQIFDLGHHFPQSELRDLFIHAINYCIKQINDGNTEYLNESFDLYREGLAKDIFLNNGRLSRFTYTNIVAAGIKIGELNWVEQFIEDYKPKLERKYREATYKFNKGRLAYEQKNYNTALEMLQQADYKDILNNLIARTLLIKIYYELGEDKLLDSTIDAMKVFIIRKKLMGYHRTTFLNLLSYTRKLIATNPYDQKAKEKLKNQIEGEHTLQEKEWLLQQLEV